MPRRRKTPPDAAAPPSGARRERRARPGRTEGALEARLREAEDTLRAIRGGDVDAIIVHGPRGEQVFTLRGAEHPYRILVEAMSEGAATLSSEGTILYCNRSFARMVGLPLERVMGTALAEHVPSTFLPAVEALLRGRSAKGEVALKSRKGGPVPILLSVNEMRFDGEDLRCLVATDLTEVGRLQDAIRARDEFISIASHELKTPLTAVLLQLDSVLRAGSRDPDEPLPGRVADRLHTVRRQARRLANLVNDLLDVSRIRAGRLELELADVDVAAVCQDVADRHRREAQDARCALELRVQGPVHARSDPGRLDQVVTNLLTNAVKYGKGKPVRISVEHAGDRARLVVEDQGIGIAPGDHARIFRRFERAAAGPEYGGMGLGLWIVRELVDQMGGTIHVQSRLGEGARFVVELPLSEASASTPAA